MLPIADFREEIINSICNNYVTIITAETGSGKSTQVPQYIVNDFEQIIVTEPRIMAAKSLAKRVAEEMEWTLGREVGYKTGYDKYYSEEYSQILFCTDALQLIKTIFEKDTTKNNVLVIDEVHEWNLNIETLLAWCKHMKGIWNTKVVILSATIEAESLARYFGKEDSNVIHVPGRTYDVEVEERNETELESTISEYIDEGKNILVFVPGKKEIQNIVDDLSEKNATFLPLHGEMEWEDQRKCFNSYGNPKVIVATNIAQTSLTIPDIDVVIDTGLVRLSIVRDGIQGLYIRDISKADILQRQGRAGRTKNGKYILCSNTPIEARKEYTVPEIQRSILDRVVLQLAAIGLDAEMLEFYHQPKEKEINHSKEELVSIGAFDSNYQVTELGYEMVKLPVSVQIAKMIIEAKKRNVLMPVIVIAAILEIGSLLSDASYYEFTYEKESDLLAELDVWTYLNNLEYIDFEELGISQKNYEKIKEHVKKLVEVLNIKEDDEIFEKRIYDDYSERKKILISCLSGLISNVYFRTESKMAFESKNKEIRSLSKHSCIKLWSNNQNYYIIGIPITIQSNNQNRNYYNIITSASIIGPDTLVEIMPDTKLIKTTKCSYSEENDSVKVLSRYVYMNRIIYEKISFEKNHPLYNELKKEYQKIQKRLSTYKIDNIHFDVDYTSNKPIIKLGTKFLFRTSRNEVYLSNKEKIWFICDRYKIEKDSIYELRECVWNEYINELIFKLNLEYSKLKLKSIKGLIANSHKLNKIKLNVDEELFNGREKYVYGAVKLSGKNNLIFYIELDESLARHQNQKTFCELFKREVQQNSNLSSEEALKTLFLKHIRRKYADKKFIKDKKRKELLPPEKEKKENLFSLVREVLNEINPINFIDTLSMIDEYYNELMGIN